jgi:hypothetical protein
MNFKKVNNLTGWAVFLVALATYMLTREARGSLWDCGEFVASADKMQLPHPPGAPLFTLLGRFFIILFGDNPMTAASAVNFMSALASAATILFLFWTITHFARKMFVNVGEQLTNEQIFTTMAAGVVGGLAYTFSDSFWFSAVEGEVYALSSFFTALVFWAMLKWEHADEHAGNDPFAKARSDRWIIFLFFMMGLSIGVHLLNLLVIPAVVMIYYYRRYQPTTKGALLAFLVGCLITGIVQVGVIQYSMKAAGLFDVYFVNSFGMGFFSGFTVYFILVAAVIAWALSFKERSYSKTQVIVFLVIFLVLSAWPFFTTIGSGAGKFFKFLLIAGAGFLAGYFLKPGGLRVLKLGLWCYAFMMLGYFMYFTSMIRSNANPAIDMNNVDNPINLVYYLSREQYGSAPLVWGPHFAATYDDVNEENPIIEGEMRYIKGKQDGKDKYIPIGRQREYNYKSSVMQLFPRVWDPSNDQFHATFYSQWLNIPQDPSTGKYDAPSYGDNFEWFFTYQMGLMYWRYFMWNFAGKQNDIQGLGNARDGNWISGISFIDNNRLGDQSMLPESIQKNKAHNKLYMLPFILGIIGCVYQFFKNRKDWIVSFLLFFFTGIAVVLYLNQPGNQPRERDYAYVGSFYAFAIWIGLAVVAFIRMAKEREDKSTFQNMLVFGSALTFLIILFSSLRGSPMGVIITCAMVIALYLLVTVGVTYIGRAISSNWKALAGGVSILCLLVPLMMAQQEWDDHDRSHKTLAPDLAKDYLESCAPNAIIFTFGDNDTYPLWYAQEVEGVRPDIRIINNSLLGIDWYINQLRYKVNSSDSIDVIWTPEQIEGEARQYMSYRPERSQTNFYDLYDIMKNQLGRAYIDPETGRDVGPRAIPVNRFFIPVDTAAVRANGTVNATDTIISPMTIEIPKRTLDRGLYRSDLIILNIIAANKWKRPIYFTSPYGDLGFWGYLRKDGLAYRLVPTQNKFPQMNWQMEQTVNQIEREEGIGIGGTQITANNTDFMYNNLETKYGFGGADRKGVYFDEENRRHLLNIRGVFAEAVGNMADLGDKERAKKLLAKVEAGISPDNLPFALVSRFGSHNQNGLMLLEASYKAGRTDLADKIRAALRKDINEQKRYYNYLKESKPELYTGQLEGTEVFLNNVMERVLNDIEKRYAPQTQTNTQGELNKPMIITGPDTNKVDTGKR